MQLSASGMLRSMNGRSHTGSPAWESGPYGFRNINIRMLIRADSDIQISLSLIIRAATLNEVIAILYRPFRACETARQIYNARAFPLQQFREEILPHVLRS